MIPTLAISIDLMDVSMLVLGGCAILLAWAIVTTFREKRREERP